MDGDPKLPEVVLGQRHDLVAHGLDARDGEHPGVVGEGHPGAAVVASLDHDPPAKVVAAQTEGETRLGDALAEVEHGRGGPSRHDSSIPDLRAALGAGRRKAPVEGVGHARGRLLQNAEVAQVGARRLVDVPVQTHGHQPRTGRSDLALEGRGVGVLR